MSPFFAKNANSVGLTTQHMARNKKPPGPCITSVMDFRKTNGNHKKGFVVEDGTPPSVISGMYSVGLSVVAKLIGIEKYSSAELLERAWQVGVVTKKINKFFQNLMVEGLKAPLLFESL